MSKSKATFHYQNLSLVKLPNEIWKDIPGYKGLYKISNYGRVKSLSREIAMNSPHGGVYISKEKIRRASLDVKLNKTVNKPLYSLLITLSKEGIKYYYAVARLVYFVFSEKFDLENNSIWISYKDHDGRNVHISNLVKSDIPTIKLSSYKTGRAISHLKVLSKPVTQYDLHGHPINSFPSMYEAGKILDFNPRSISEVVNGKCHLYNGYFWKLGKHARTLDLSAITRNVEREQIHQNLKKRLKLKNVDLKSPPAFLNLSTKSMKGEVWKDVPNYKGLYQISNFGRVKALQKITFGKHQKWMPEQIQRITVDFRTDSKGKEVPGTMFACVARDGKKKLISVPRLVYYLFVRKFKISDTTVRVYYKDNNSLNVRGDNLILKRGVWSFKKIQNHQ